MSAELGKIRSELQRLVGSAEAAAALAVHFGNKAGLVNVPDDMARGISAVANAILGDTSQMPPEQARAMAGMTRGLLTQAAAFAAQPDRPEAWSVTDPVVLQSLGQASAVFAPYICGPLAARLEGLSDALAGTDVTILDVGVGVGALAIAFAGALPGARVAGIDVWEPALMIARTNVTSAGLGSRIELRKQDVCSLEDKEAFDLVWFSGPFIPGGLQRSALARCFQSMKHGAWLVYGAFGGRDPLSSALADLRTLRSGGPVLSDGEVITMLQDAGLSSAQASAVDLAIPSRIIVGRKPAKG